MQVKSSFSYTLGCLILLHVLLGSNLLLAQAPERPLLDSSRWAILGPGEVSLPDIRETSPSITASGDTLVFARTQNWGDKVPYLAVRQGEGWQVIFVDAGDLQVMELADLGVAW